MRVPYILERSLAEPDDFRLVQKVEHQPKTGEKDSIFSKSIKGCLAGKLSFKKNDIIIAEAQLPPKVLSGSVAAKGLEGRVVKVFAQKDPAGCTWCDKSDLNS